MLNAENGRERVKTCCRVTATVTIYSLRVVRVGQFVIIACKGSFFGREKNPTTAAVAWGRELASFLFSLPDLYNIIYVYTHTLAIRYY